MKRSILDSVKKLALIAGLIALGYNTSAVTFSVTINSGAISNLYSASLKVTQVLLTSTTSTNTTVQLIDNNVGSTTNVQSAYTNTISYGTNYISLYTNFFGVINTNYYTNVLVDASSTISAVTNTAPVRLAVSALGSTSYAAGGVTYYFGQGVTINNTGSGTATVTVTGSSQ